MKDSDAPKDWNEGRAWGINAREVADKRNSNGVRQLHAGRRDRKGGFILFDELDASESRKVWLVENLLGAGEVSAFYGKKGAGKSILVEDMALHIAADRKWHGRKVMHCAVLYVALERKKVDERRALAFRKKHNLTKLPFAIMGGVHDFRNPKTAEHLAEVGKAVERETGQRLGLIIIDTLSRALCGGDENSPTDMGALVHVTSILQERTGAHVLWVHHPPKGGDELRGHTSLPGALDTTVHVEKINATLHTASVVLANDGQAGERVTFELESVTVFQDEDGLTTGLVVVPADVATTTAAKPPPKLSPRDRNALDALTDALANGSKPAPPSFQLPAQTKVVTLDEWREEYKRRGLQGDAKNPRQPFLRTREKLQANHLIGVRDGLVWKCDPN